MITIYAKTVDYDSFVLDMELLDSRFVTDVEGATTLLKYTHDWSIDYIGKMVQTPAVVDSSGNVTTPAVMWDGERANIVVHDNMEEWFLSVLPTGEMANGTSFTEVIPITPERIYLGSEIEVDDTKVDKTEEAFSVGKKVQTGKKLTYNGTTYIVRIAHTTQADWTPDTVPALFKEVVEQGQEWVQPTGAQDAYNTGDVVTYEGQQWRSKIDANTTVPDGDEPFNRYWEPI